MSDLMLQGWLLFALMTAGGIALVMFLMRR
jgi:hypothetical protein